MNNINKYDIKVGDIFHAEWGYNMINHDFYKVVELKGTQTVVLRRLKTRNTRDDGYGQCGYLKMVDELEDNVHFCQPLTKKVQLCSYNNNKYVKITNYHNAYLMRPEDYDDEYYFNYLD